MVFRLERQVTGFRYGKEPPLPEFPVGRFRGACHATARVARGAVEQVVEKSYPRIFHSAVIVVSGSRFAVVCNAIYPWVAFVLEDTEYVADPGTFLDPPAWSAVMVDMGFLVMSRQLLESPLTAVDTTALGKGEWLQIHSWRPANVGQTVFNSWE